MEEHHLTPDNFDSGLRDTLRYKHGFEHADLERAKGIVGDVHEFLKEKGHTKLGLSKEHFDTTMEFLNKKHVEWKNLSDSKKAHIETALKEHFGLHEEAA
jgi:hypothetical protein